MNTLSDQQKFLIKIVAVMCGSLGGWILTLTTWHAALTTSAIGGLLAILGVQLWGILGIVPPSATRNVDIALLSGVHTRDEVDKVAKATSPGTVPTPETAAAILGLPAPGPAVPRTSPSDVPTPDPINH